MQPGDLIAGRFTVEALAGRGGMGAVYRASDSVTGERVAIKTLRGEVDLRERERFVREAMVLSRVSHPNVVRYVAHGVTDAGERYLAMEWLDGDDLHALLRAGPLGVESTVALLHGVAKGLAAVHALGIVHRDLKPRNLVIPDGDVARVRLLDFGIARWDDVMSAMTRTGHIVGTPGYMAPEQVRGERDLDPRVDVFALGCVAFECLTGRPAFEGDGAISVLARVLFEAPPKIRAVRPEAPVELEALVERMLSKERALRPNDGAEAAALLAEIGAPSTMLAGTPDLRDEAITRREQRVCCAVLATSNDRTGDASWRRELELIASATGQDARVESLVEGSSLVVMTGDGAASDLAARACRCALALRAVAPGLTLSVSTGRGEAEGSKVTGEVVDRAAARSRAAKRRRGAAAGAVYLDDTTANLLDASFDVRERDEGWVLRGEGEPVSAGRTVLGRAVPFVGRDRELGALNAAWDECVEEGVARAVLITAPAGAGKSRLRREWLGALARRGEDACVLLGRGDAMRSGAPYGMLASALRRDGGLHEGATAGEREARLRAWVARTAEGESVARLTAFLGELVGVRLPIDDVELRAARADARLMSDQVRRAWETWLRTRCDARPVVLVLDDLQWGDLPSVTLIDSALRNLRDRRLLVVAFGRPEVREVFPALWRERAVHEVALGDLTRRASERITRAVLGDNLSPAEVDRLVSLSQGNPFYLEEMLRAAGEGRGDEVPESALAMAMARLDALPAESRQVLRAGSVFGRVFWASAVARLVGAREALTLRARLDDLTQREVIERRAERRFVDHEELAFCHDLVREAAYASLTAEDLTLAHRLALEWLEDAGEADALSLAEHAERGGERARAATLFERAASRALEASDLGAAIARAERAAALGASGSTLGALRFIQAEAYRWRGEPEPAMRCALEAASLLPRDDPRWYAALAGLGVADLQRGDGARFESLARELCAPPADAGLERAQVIAIARLAQQGVLAGRREGVATLLAWIDAYEARREIEDLAVAAWLREVRAFTAMYDGDPARCGRFLSEAIERRVRLGDRRTASTARMNLGFARIELGDHRGAEEALREVIEAADELGLSGLSADAKQNVGLAQLRRGALREARETLSEVVEFSRARGLVRGEGTTRTYLAQTLAALGELDRAEAEAVAAVGTLAPSPPRRAYALATLAQIRLDRGAAGSALAPAREAMEVLASLGGLDEGEAMVRRVWAEALHETGDAEGARGAIAAAVRRLRERASKIAEEADRRSFLERVDDNARTLSLAYRWGVEG